MLPRALSWSPPRSVVVQVRAGRRMLSVETTVDAEDARMPAEWKVVAHLAQLGTRGGVQVAPRRGSALVFWTMDKDCRVDPRSWHAHARVAPGGGGKLVLWKEKQLPRYFRRPKGGNHWERGWEVGGANEGVDEVEKAQSERTIDDMWKAIEKETGPVGRKGGVRAGAAKDWEEAVGGKAAPEAPKDLPVEAAAQGEVESSLYEVN